MTGRERKLQAVSTTGDGDADGVSAEELLCLVARGDDRAFERLYDVVAGKVLSLVRRVLRDHAQSEEVTQEVLVEVWRTAARYDPERGSAMAWVMTMAHRRAVDRVRSAQSATRREDLAARRDVETPFDAVSEQVASRIERRQVQRCLTMLTELQRESILLGYFQGYTYPETASVLGIPLGTVKTRMRDGLIRLRDCLGVTR
ncbi:ECF RNA polymerase sigma factor SigK [Saccharothrix sp. 6-C]|uniref:RNA polymerase sigma-70 factor (ECF subfamily) n=1 Tax=Saccharothrix texasensis TaxID=103734 RepID=A0A3N1HJR2_9PSEU|nr:MULTISPECIES: ECF RNA polymerase sigma factor SigK [Saccharothrix]QQQ73479.1 ECF RNA polymerase sigma factor SigK [Saccharothrix sp. 6-C]ROP42691.1 RNA polymerase sigma-70 factor (ECF subfamily) [Saccharothrix texasensis]